MTESFRRCKRRTTFLPIAESPTLATLLVVTTISIIAMSGNATASSGGDAYAASSTSCYTTEEKKDSYSTLSEILSTKCPDDEVRQVILDMMAVCADITEALRVNLVTVEGSSNVFGDSQLSVDVREPKTKQGCRLGNNAEQTPCAQFAGRFCGNRCVNRDSTVCVDAKTTDPGYFDSHCAITFFRFFKQHACSSFAIL